MDDLYQKYLESALHFLSYRMRSEKEVRDNLVKKSRKLRVFDSEAQTRGDSAAAGNASTAIEKVIMWLKEQRFINDVEFARMWMESRARSKPKSLRLIKMELKQKGIAQDIIDIVAVDPDTVIGSDAERAKKIAVKKYPKYKHLPKQEIYQKLGGVLARNGFDWEVIKRSIDEVLDNGV